MSCTPSRGFKATGPTGFPAWPSSAPVCGTVPPCSPPPSPPRLPAPALAPCPLGKGDPPSPFAGTVCFRFRGVFFVVLLLPGGRLRQGHGQGWPNRFFCGNFRRVLQHVLQLLVGVVHVIVGVRKINIEKSKKSILKNPKIQRGAKEKSKSFNVERLKSPKNRY